MFAIHPPGILPPLHYHCTRLYRLHLRQNFHVPREINSLSWDNVSLVKETVIPYPAILYLTILACRPSKKALSCSRLYLKSGFLLLFLTHIPNPALKISQIQHPAKPIVDPLDPAPRVHMQTVSKLSLADLILLETLVESKESTSQQNKISIE